MGDDMIGAVLDTDALFLQTENEQLRRRHVAVFTLIGRIDYFLETQASMTVGERNKLAAQLRREIDALIGKNAP